MSTETTNIDGEDLRAAEFVLGLLGEEARRDAESRLRDDPAFAAEVGRWQARFEPWLHAIAPVEAPSGAWSRIRSSLWSHELPERTAIPPEHAHRAKVPGFWRHLAIAGIAATAASLGLLALALHQRPSAIAPVVATSPQPVVRPMAVMLRQDDGSVAYTATLDAGGMLVVTPVQANPDARVPELWLIPAGEKPQSLGMLSRDRAMAMRVPSRLLAVARDGLFAVSMEPAGSGPHEAPTGPVVAKGSLIAL